MSPSREVCCSQCATARSASCHWPVSRPRTQVPWEPVRVYRLRTGSSRTRRARPARSSRGSRRPGTTSTHRRRGRRPGGLGGRSRRGMRGRSRCSWIARSSGRRTAGSAVPGGPPRSGARAGARPWHAARRPGARHTGQRLCGGCPGAGPAPCRRGLCARRTAGHTAGARPSARVRSRAPSLQGPTSGRAALPRSRWPGCSSWPRPWPGRGPPASRCTPGHSPCSGLRQPPTANPPSAGTAELTTIVRWCMGVTLEQTMHQGWRNGRSRSETNEAEVKSVSNLG